MNIPVITVTWEDVETQDSGPAMPDHLARWGYSNKEWDRWQATWTLSGRRKFDAVLPDGLRGCPLGRAYQEDSAIADLIYRTERESMCKIVGLEKPRGVL